MLLLLALRLHVLLHLREELGAKCRVHKSSTLTTLLPSSSNVMKKAYSFL